MSEFEKESERYRWCVDRFYDLALDMINNKLIPHNYVIIALGETKHKVTAECSILSEIDKRKTL